MTEASYQRPECCDECEGAVGVLAFVLGRTHAAAESEARNAVILCSLQCLADHIEELRRCWQSEGWPPLRSSELSWMA